MKAAFAVGAAKGFPFEVWVLFSSRHEAQRHAKRAAYEFSVFAIPVYEENGEVPQALRPATFDVRHMRDRASYELALTADGLTSGEIEPVKPGPVVAVGDL